MVVAAVVGDVEHYLGWDVLVDPRGEDAHLEELLDFDGTRELNGRVVVGVNGYATCAEVALVELNAAEVNGAGVGVLLKGYVARKLYLYCRVARVRNGLVVVGYVLKAYHNWVLVARCNVKLLRIGDLDAPAVYQDVEGGALAVVNVGDREGSDARVRSREAAEEHLAFAADYPSGLVSNNTGEVVVDDDVCIYVGYSHGNVVDVGDVYLVVLGHVGVPLGRSDGSLNVPVVNFYRGSGAGLTGCNVLCVDGYVTRHR